MKLLETYRFSVLDGHGKFSDGAVKSRRSEVHDVMREHLAEHYPDWECVVYSGPGIHVCDHRNCTPNYRIEWRPLTPDTVLPDSGYLVLHGPEGFNGFELPAGCTIEQLAADYTRYRVVRGPE